MISLRITEIFYSLQGETRTVGLPTVFIRLTGCPLRCQYCDTAYAFTGGQRMELDEILQRVADFKPQYVTVTGGEPLAQKEGCLALLTALCDKNYQVSLETSGAIDAGDVDSRVVKILDLKTPGSGEMTRNDYNNVAYLTHQDQVKFVICDRVDYDWAVAQMAKYDLSKRCEVLFSPSYQQISVATLADWILQDNLPVRLQIQLHKYIWGDVKGK